MGWYAIKINQSHLKWKRTYEIFLKLIGLTHLFGQLIMQILQLR